MARRGPRRGGVDTRMEILKAARLAFAERGYHAATIRAIASAAQVDPALVMHYFGTKEDLFAACLDLPLRPGDVERVVFADGIDSAGENLARLFFRVWDDPESRSGLLAMLGGAFTNETAAAALREFFANVLVERLTGRLEGPDPELRMAMAASHLVGLAVLRYVVGFEQLEEAGTEELIELVAPRLQGYLAG